MAAATTTTTTTNAKKAAAAQNYDDVNDWNQFTLDFAFFASLPSARLPFPARSLPAAAANSFRPTKTIRPLGKSLFELGRARALKREKH